MTQEEIIKIDLEKNYPDLSLEEGLEIFQSYLADGYSVEQINNTLFVYTVDGDVVQYHSINADPLKQYINNVKEFFAMMSDKKKAITTLDEPRLQSVVRRYFSDIIVIHGEYAITNLQEV